ncbi:MAG: zinc-ribbon domain-containing protein [Clostridiales bacterium]|nr:zinc-ribbon domain-containing protein [Clostridiales bacterium]
MPLITCPDCGKQVSDRAPYCSDCGCPISNLEALSTVKIMLI